MQVFEGMIDAQVSARLFEKSGARLCRPRPAAASREVLAHERCFTVEKRILAWWVYGHTTVTRRWIAESLRMGYESGVSRAVSFVESSAANEVMTMKSKLRNADVR